MKTKTFDCVKMKHEAAVKIHEQTKNMTLEEELAFWRKASRKLVRRQAALKANKAAKSR